VIPASAELIRLYADYLNREYGTLDSDYVFVNLWGHPRGHPLTYPAVYDLVGRLRRRTGVVFGPHHYADVGVMPMFPRTPCSPGVGGREVSA
jgi:integrase/recombinase XerD